MSTDRMLAVIWTMAIASIGAAASAQTIDFEQFENRDNIFGLDLGGVSLRPRFGSQVHVYADNFVGNGHHSPVNSIIASNGGCRADLNGDGNVNTQDFIAYLNEWAAGC